MVGTEDVSGESRWEGSRRILGTERLQLTTHIEKKNFTYAHLHQLVCSRALEDAFRVVHVRGLQVLQQQILNEKNT